MQTDLEAGIGTPDEQRLGGRVAGLLYLVGAVTTPFMPLLPGVGTGHWEIMVALGLVAGVWGTLCLTVVDFGRASRAVFLIPGLFALAMIATATAASGGAHSPARYFVMFAVVYAACFYRRFDAVALVGLCLVVAASPVIYDGADIDGPYLGELGVLLLAYVALAATIMAGKHLVLRARQEAQDLAMHDPLTSLANRRAMLHWLEARFERNDREPLGLLLVDLDGFKDVNTLHGYQMGDRVLCGAARALESCVREGDMVARLGGDEFAVLVPVPDAAMVDLRVQQMMEALRDLGAGLDLPGVALTASVGWVIYPHDATTIEELIAMADVCLRDAKSAGKDRAVSPI